MRNFINTAATDPAKARTVGLTQTTPEPFPVIVLGTSPTQQWFFANRGAIESWSGAADYSLRVTLGDVFVGADAGTWEIQVGTNTPITLGWDANAAGIQNALNDDATITSEGGVDVVAQDVGRFLIAYRSEGVVTGLTTDGALLVPDCNATVTTLTTGATGVRQLVSLTLSRSPIAQVSNWGTITSPSPGWSGVLPIDTPAAFQLLITNGKPRGAVIEVQTLLTVEVIDNTGNSQAYYQTPVTLRAPNYAVAAATSMQQDFFVKPLITGLASNVADGTKLGGLSTANGEYPVGGTVQCLFTSDVVANFIRKSSTANQAVPFIVRPYDYDAGNNAYQWIADRVTKGGQPCLWDDDISLWTYIVSAGNANSVSIAVDQTGFALPS